ncbi:MAG: type II toxin-antitoxin system HicA family toxin [Legionella sp.]|nr:type II toxin-antitoxin system HicA family toxin [Legionella sp.]
MSKFDKLIIKMRSNPRDWRIDDLKAVAERLGIEYRQPGTSHVTFRLANGSKITVPAHKPIKPIYIKQFIDLLDEGGFCNE